MAQRKTAAEIIGFHFGWDIRDVSENRYQPTRYSNPAIYLIGQDYYAAPSDNRTPRCEVGKPWVEVAEYYGRKVFYSECQ